VSPTVPTARCCLTSWPAGKKITYELIDGANAQNRDARAALWEVSGKRAIYPQLFAKHAESGVHDFIGDWAAIFELVESNEVTHGLDAALASLATSGPVAEVK